MQDGRVEHGCGTETSHDTDGRGGADKQSSAIAHGDTMVNLAPLSSIIKPPVRTLVYDLADIQPSGSSSPVFPYAPLDKTKREVRLTTLKPGLASQPIECTLRNVHLNQKGIIRYKALSYTWGPQNQPRKIICLQGLAVSVQENLWQALYHIRSQTTELEIWIDAICINQRDELEKNHQVPIMDVIYNLAYDVIVWLGTGNVRSAAAMAFLAENASSGEHRKSLLPPGFTSRYSRELWGLRDLFDREYWSRAWIIQEILMARTFTIHCGHQQLPGKILVELVGDIWDRLNEEQRTRFMTPSDNLKALCRSRPARLLWNRDSQSRSLEELLDTYKDSLCQRPCDKVYSLLALTNQTLCKSSVTQCSLLSGGKIVDYTKSDLELFRTLVREFVSEEPGSAFQVKRMKLLQNILRLSPPDLEWPVHEGLAPDHPPSHLLGNEICITSMGRCYSKVLSCGPLGHGEHIERLEEAKMWYTELVRSTEWLEQCFPSWSDEDMVHLVENEPENILRHPAIKGRGQRASTPTLTGDWLETELDRLNNDNMRRLGIYSNSTVAPSFRLFADTRGRIGLGKAAIEENDQLVEFKDTDVKLVIRRAGTLCVVGRAIILGSDVGEDGFDVGPATDESVTLPLEQWRSLIW